MKTHQQAQTQEWRVTERMTTTPRLEKLILKESGGQQGPDEGKGNVIASPEHYQEKGGEITK